MDTCIMCGTDSDVQNGLCYVCDLDATERGREAMDRFKPASDDIYSETYWSSRPGQLATLRAKVSSTARQQPANKNWTGD